MLPMMIKRDAVISADIKFRYTLTRQWRRHGSMMAAILLNPSKADAQTDDPTVRVVVGRAYRMNYAGVIILNAFALRATKPEALVFVNSSTDAIGPENDLYLSRVLRRPDIVNVMVGWGDDGVLYGRAHEVLHIIEECGQTPMCLGVTKQGHPRHPLRVSYSTELVRYER